MIMEKLGVIAKKERRKNEEKKGRRSSSSCPDHPAVPPDHPGSPALISRVPARISRLRHPKVPDTRLKPDHPDTEPDHLDNGRTSGPSPGYPGLPDRQHLVRTIRTPPRIIRVPDSRISRTSVRTIRVPTCVWPKLGRGPCISSPLTYPFVARAYINSPSPSH
jgi:hypothetical protein